jgi:hypothetical protein
MIASSGPIGKRAHQTASKPRASAAWNSGSHGVHVVLDGDAEVDLGDRHPAFGLERLDVEAGAGERLAVGVGAAAERPVVEPAVALGAERVERRERRHRLLRPLQEHRQVRAAAAVDDLLDDLHAGILSRTCVPAPGADSTVQSPP